MNGLEAAVAPVLAWLAANPAWAGVAIGLIALAESLAIIGLLVPGAVLMFMAGAAVGSSQLPIVPMLIWAIAGAILGDGLSYWLGRHYRDRLRHLPVIRHYPGALHQAEGLFQRHGGKSVVMGRFVGPVRPVIPAVVGMLGMPPGRFLLANISSALAWGPAYLLPGVVFGASLLLALEVMGRLMAWLVIIFGGFFFLRWLLPRIDRPMRFAGSRLARGLGRQPPRGPWRQWLRPLHAALRALRHRSGWLWWAGFLSFVLTSALSLSGSIPHGWEQGIIAIANAQRSELLRELAWRVTQLGGLLPVILASLVLAVWLWRDRQPRKAVLLVMAVGLAEAVSYGLKILLAVPRPNALSASADFAAAFPSAHVAGIAVLVTVWVSTLPPRRSGVIDTQAWVMGLGAVLVTLVAASRLLLGVHWPLDVVGGVGIGITFGALPGILTRVPTAPLRARYAVSVSAGVLVLAAVATQTLHWPDPLQAYPEQTRIPFLANSEPASPDSQTLERRLGAGGFIDDFAAVWPLGQTQPAGFALDWQAAPRWRWQTWLRWLSPKPSPAFLPVLPRWHDGRLPSVVLTRVHADQRSRVVLRAWPKAKTATATVWLLSFEHETIRGGVLLPRFDRRALAHKHEQAILDAAARQP